MSVTVCIIHDQHHNFLFGAANSLLSQSVPISKSMILNSTGKSINKDLPNNQYQIIGKEPSSNYIADLNMIIPHITTEFLLLVNSKNVFYKNMIEKLIEKMNFHPHLALTYSDCDIFFVTNNTSIRAFLPSYDSRFIVNGVSLLPNFLVRVDALKAMHPFVNTLQIAQRYLFGHVPHPLYMERSFEQPKITNGSK